MRLRHLDVLRAFAVLLVMVRHLKEGKDNPGLVGLVAHIHQAPADLRHLPELALWALYRVGWAGVDLFFVLSGFLCRASCSASTRSRATSASGGS